MGIDGSEYDVIVETSDDLLKRFRILVVEFHLLEHLVSPMGYRLISSCFDKLSKNFKVVHMHPDNRGALVKFAGLEIPQVLEVTLLRTDRFSAPASRARTFPHPLDAPNSLASPDYPLPGCWYQWDAA